MTKQTGIEQPATLTVAPLKNVALAHRAMLQAINRPQNLPGIVCVNGPSGIGKSNAAAYVSNKLRCYYVELKETWTRKALLLAICRQMGIAPAKVMYEMLEQIAEHLVITQRPLIIDDFDYAADKNYAEVIRDIYESSGAAIMIIGEEDLPQKLSKWERLHNRVLEWCQAVMCDLDDARHLVKLYAPGITICDELLKQIVIKTKGCTRRISININIVQKFADAEGIEHVDAKLWDTSNIVTGKPPAARQVRMS